MNCRGALTAALDRSQKLRAAQFEAESRLEAARNERERSRAEVVSLEALQKAALGRGDSRTAEWLNGSGLARQPRLAAQLGVRDGWERAVETALGDYLEALCVDELDALADVLPTLPVGRLSLLQAGAHMEADGAAGMLSGVVSRTGGDRAAAVACPARGNPARRTEAAPRACARRIGHHPHGRVDRTRLAARQPRRRSAFGRARTRAAPQAAAQRARAQRRKRARHRSAPGRLPRRTGAGRARTRCGAEPHPGRAPRSRRPAGSARRRARACTGIHECGASAWKKKPPMSAATSSLAQDALARARAELDRGLVSRSMRSIHGARASKPIATTVARPCRRRVRARRPRSSPAATC